MKTYTKKTEEQYLEYLNGYTQVLKQEYADRILEELREQGLIYFGDIVVSIAIQMLHQRQRQLKHKNLKKRLQQCVKRLMN